MPTKIEWATEVWNAIVGCSRCSEGCDMCYAINVVARQMSPQHKGLTIRRPGEPPDWNGKINVVERALDQPTRWRRPRRIFVNSLSDLFHPEVFQLPQVRKQHRARLGPPTDVLVLLLAEMVANPRHSFLVLTKRPQVMAAVLRDPMIRLMVNGALLDRGLPVMPDPSPHWWPPHIGWGTSIELDKYAFRANHLRAINGTRWISAEPLLGGLPSLDLTGISWIVVGGESKQPGHHARPMHPDWARALRDRCVPGETAFFFKQWGHWGPDMPDGSFGITWSLWNPEEVGTLSCIQDLGNSTFTRSGVDASAATTVHAIYDTGRAYRMQKGPKGRRLLDGRTWDEYPPELTVDPA